MTATTPSQSTPESFLSTHELLSPDPLLYLLQLASPALPVGAYSYSEGLETLVQNKIITTAADLSHWLQQELRYGAIRLESVVIARTYQAMTDGDLDAIAYWNHWLSAIRDTVEMREQSWQMGRTLGQLLKKLVPELAPTLEKVGTPCNLAIAFAIASAHWKIDHRAALSGYLHSWLTNQIGAGIKLIPLGQTEGQSLLLKLYPDLQQTVEQGLTLPDSGLYGCSWGMAIASMNHETLYSRLFRS
ncbi:MAG: urease accessory protein UreF [Merismopedia sp. SIO2A8]|nr:urease accessory protein UreF [Merismopedia sp. SIO2A8]